MSTDFKHFKQRLLLITSLFLFSGQVQAEISDSITLSSDTEINYTVYKAEGTQLLLWFYSEAGPQPTDKILADKLSKRGIEVWLIDLFDSYFLPIALSSMDKIPASDISELIEAAHQQSGKTITAISTGRSAIPLLRAVSQHQTSLPDSNALTGLILLSPKFYTKTPEPGQQGTLMPVVSNSNALLFIIQPNQSPWFWKLDKTIPALEKSGSDVYLQIIDNVRDRFYFRPDATTGEKETTNKLSQLIHNAMTALSNHPDKIRRPGQNKSTPPKAVNTKKDKSLQLHKGKTRPPELELLALNDRPINLNNLKGKVVLVNFWASWCPPCVHEMPSMQRIQDHFKKDKFVILGVNMAEEKQTINTFIEEKVAVNFPILMDTDGAALKRWQVFAFPTSYLLDKKGNIRYSLFGSIEWDKPETMTIINELINE